MTPEENIEAFWTALENSWEIEPREYFEREAPKNGFGSPLAMAVHYMWKREVKGSAEEAGARLERERIVNLLAVSEYHDPGKHLSGNCDICSMIVLIREGEK